MHHPTSTALPYNGHLPLRVVLKLLLFAALGAFLILAQSLALLITGALGAGLTLAVKERLRKLDASHSAPVQPLEGHRVGDGGAFPGREPEAHFPISGPGVIDGGSLEHHRP